MSEKRKFIRKRFTIYPNADKEGYYVKRKKRQVVIVVKKATK